jgi:DNA N-6-adenine-methyltransferase Dam
LAKHTVKFSVNGKRITLGAVGSPNPYAMGTGGGDEWCTPVEYLEMARKVLGGFDTCPASSAFAQRRFDFGPQCRHYTKANNGPTKPWRGRVWLNPLFSKGLTAAFIDKLIEEYSSGRVSAAILLTGAFTANAWFQKAGHTATAICLMKKRIEFELEGVTTPGTQIYGQTFFYFGDNAGPFMDTFRSHGVSLLNPNARTDRAVTVIGRHDRIWKKAAA